MLLCVTQELEYAVELEERESSAAGPSSPSDKKRIMTKSSSGVGGGIPHMEHGSQQGLVVVVTGNTMPSFVP